MASAAAQDIDDAGVLHGREQRGAPRFTALIRAAKLISPRGEFICVLRDVSATGVRLRCFHALPQDRELTLELQSGALFALHRVRAEGAEASYRFAAPVAVENLLLEPPGLPRRRLRVNIAIPLTLRTLAGPVTAVTQNIAQQGCRLISAAPLALAQPMVLQAAGIAPIRARVRWRRDGACGLVFDDTFQLRDLARTVARLQSPELVSE